MFRKAFGTSCYWLPVQNSKPEMAMRCCMLIVELSTSSLTWYLGSSERILKEELKRMMERTKRTTMTMLTNWLSNPNNTYCRPQMGDACS